MKIFFILIIFIIFLIFIIVRDYQIKKKKLKLNNGKKYSIIYTFFSCNVLKKSKALKKEVELIKISTPKGDMVIWLYDKTPVHKANFLKLTKEGFYNGITFHRVINKFMIQGGDPNTKESTKTNKLEREDQGILFLLNFIKSFIIKKEY